MSEAPTPMIRQYQEIKSQHKDAILFYRLGDFYEMFYDDAKLASKELELTLTGRGEGANRMPMCGIPYHAASNYIAKLISRGHKVAICEQVEDPATAKGVVKREVVKIITPGTVLDEKMLQRTVSNYLMAISFDKNFIGLAYVDASTGDMRATCFEGSPAKLIDELSRIEPSEVLIPDIVAPIMQPIIEKLKDLGYFTTIYKDIYDKETSLNRLKKQFKVASVEGFGLNDLEPSWGAVCAALDYLSNTQKGSLEHISTVRTYKSGDFMFIDSSTKRNLELLSTIRERSNRGSLAWVLDMTSTPMGSRMMKKWMLEPLLDVNKINLRLDCVEELSKDMMQRSGLAAELKTMSDLERVTGRIASGACNARDMVSLKESLEKISKIKEMLSKAKANTLRDIAGIDTLAVVHELIGSSIRDDAPHTIKDGGMIKEGYDKELDEIRALTKGGKEWISQLEIKERQKTGIKSLKVGYTSVFGYYIEISKSNLDHVPNEYIRKQTLVNCERYITPDLKEKESMIMNAQEKMSSMEYEIFQSIRAKIAANTKELQQVAEMISTLDVLVSLSECAAVNRYVRPVVEENGDIRIKEGRHPVVEKMLSDRYTPNDIEMNRNGSRFLLITGPNMAGKSTYMRQAALICLMAQIGSFVPASSARLPLIDRIFTRIGAMDDIYSGQSTFMLEMTETANIINNASDKSFVILDEIGRGTSTFDGMSIAAAVAEYVHGKIKAFTMFATHYHEITKLADSHKGIKNMNTLVEKEGDRVIFLHKVAEGAADQSYGIEVARLAGIPNEIVVRAKEIYNTLEMVENDLAAKKKGGTGRPKDQMGLF